MKAFSSYKCVLYHLNLKISNSHPRLGLNATKPLTVKNMLLDVTDTYGSFYTILRKSLLQECFSGRTILHVFNSFAISFQFYLTNRQGSFNVTKEQP